VARVLIIDDDDRLAEMLSQYLGERGVDADRRGDGLTGLEALKASTYDALILDVMLPDIDGFEVLRRLRANSSLPVLMLTARGDELDRIVGLEIGADDYLPKPFNPRELLARLNAVLRRVGSQGEPRPDGDERGVLRFDELEIDPVGRRVTRAGELCDLTSHQFDLLLVLAERVGRVQTRDQLMQAVRGQSLEAFDRSIDVHISRIRQAVERDPAKPSRILTVRGVGYVFAS